MSNVRMDTMDDPIGRGTIWALEQRRHAFAFQGSPCYGRRRHRPKCCWATPSRCINRPLAHAWTTVVLTPAAKPNTSHAALGTRPNRRGLTGPSVRSSCDSARGANGGHGACSNTTPCARLTWRQRGLRAVATSTLSVVESTGCFLGDRCMPSPPPPPSRPSLPPRPARAPEDAPATAIVAGVAAAVLVIVLAALAVLWRRGATSESATLGSHRVESVQANAKAPSAETVALLLPVPVNGHPGLKKASRRA